MAKTKAQPIVVEIAGHRAEIQSIRALASDHWVKRDRLYVVLRFDKAVDSILGFGLELPVKLYDKDEFLEAVRSYGEVELNRHLQRDREDRERMKRQDEKQKALDSIAEKVKATVGLTD